MEEQLKKVISQLQEHESRIRALEGIKTAIKPSIDKGDEPIADEDIVLLIVNKIGDCAESATIQEKVIDQTKMGPKVLMCFYVTYKYFNKAWLTSGDIESITSELGIKITTGNASNKMKEMRAYLESGAVRKKGSPTPYRLNRSGEKHFDEILHGN